MKYYKDTKYIQETGSVVKRWTAVGKLCWLFYVGKIGDVITGKLKQRYQEHKHNFIYNNPDRSKFAAHVLQFHHSFNKDCFKIIKTSYDNKLINIWEQYEIYKAHKTHEILNEQLPNFNNPLFKTLYKIIK